MRILLVFVCILPFLLEGTLLAQTRKPDKTAEVIDAVALGHYNQGIKFYELGQFEAARIEFEAAHGLCSHADLLHNLSLVAEKQRRWNDAIQLEEQFLSAPTGNLSQRERDEGRGRIVRLRDELAKSQSDTQKTPPDLVEKPRANREISASDVHHRTPPGAIGLMVGGGAALLIGIGCGAGAYVTARVFDQPVTVAEEAALMSRGQALDRAGIALDVVGGAALAAGTIWTIVDRLRRTRPNQRSAASMPTITAFAR